MTWLKLRHYDSFEINSLFTTLRPASLLAIDRSYRRSHTLQAIKNKEDVLCVSVCVERGMMRAHAINYWTICIWC